MRIRWNAGDGWEVNSNLCSMSGAPDGGGSGPSGTDISQQPQSEPQSLTQTEEDSLIETLRFDPFKDGQPATPPAKATPAAASPVVTPPRVEGVQTPPAGAPGTPAGVAPQQPVDANAQALALAAERLTTAADRLATPAPSQQPGQPQADQVPPYLFDIPPQLMEAMNSENPQQRQAAVQHLVAGTARAVHTEVNKMINELKQSFPQLIHQQLQAHTYRENVRREFYSKYPMLDNPHLAPTVANITQQVMGEMVAQGQRPTWTPQLAQIIAERVFSVIPGLKPQAAPQPAPQPRPAPPQIFTPGSRPVQSGGTEADIIDTLFG